MLQCTTDLFPIAKHLSRTSSTDMFHFILGLGPQYRASSISFKPIGSSHTVAGCSLQGTSQPKTLDICAVQCMLYNVPVTDRDWDP